MLDQTDIKILTILQQRGREHLAEIAKEVDLSPPAVMERVKKLEARGIIKGFHAVLDARKVGKGITAFIGVSVSHQRYVDSFGAQMATREDVLECHHVTGEESFILKVKTADTTALEKLIAEVRSMEGVTRTVTNVVLSTPKESTVLSLEGALEAASREPRNNNDGKKAQAARKRQSDVA